MTNIKAIRLQKDISRSLLAKKTGLNYRTLMAVENGGDVKLSTLLKIAKVLNVNVKQLL